MRNLLRKLIPTALLEIYRSYKKKKVSNEIQKSKERGDAFTFDELKNEEEFIISLDNDGLAVLKNSANSYFFIGRMISFLPVFIYILYKYYTYTYKCE